MPHHPTDCDTALAGATTTQHPTPTQQQVGLLIAGAKERGELESRVTRLVAEARDAGDVILM